jgi:hypothetical protein
MEFLRKLELLVKKSRLRFPINIFAIICGIAFAFSPSTILAMFFIKFLGLSVLLESLHPSGVWSNIKDLLPASSTKIRLLLPILFRIFLFVLGIYLLYLFFGMALGA